MTCSVHTASRGWGWPGVQLGSVCFHCGTADLKIEQRSPDPKPHLFREICAQPSEEFLRLAVLPFIQFQVQHRPVPLDLFFKQQELLSSFLLPNTSSFTSLFYFLIICVLMLLKFPQIGKCVYYPSLMPRHLEMLNLGVYFFLHPETWWTHCQWLLRPLSFRVSASTEGGKAVLGSWQETCNY